jgi:26S proteasome regulatory subunit RPN2 C-terminal domain
MWLPTRSADVTCLVLVPQKKKVQKAVLSTTARSRAKKDKDKTEADKAAAGACHIYINARHVLLLLVPAVHECHLSTSCAACWSAAFRRPQHTSAGRVCLCPRFNPADGATAMDTDAKPDTAAAPDASGKETATADTTAAKDGAATKEKTSGEDGDKGAKKEDGDDEGKKEEPAAPEPGSYEIPNPARVVPAQEKFMAVPPEQRWQPVAPAARAGFMVMKDLRPGRWPPLPEPRLHARPCMFLCWGTCRAWRSVGSGLCSQRTTPYVCLDVEH